MNWEINPEMKLKFCFGFIKLTNNCLYAIKMMNIF